MAVPSLDGELPVRLSPARAGSIRHGHLVKQLWQVIFVSTLFRSKFLRPSLTGCISRPRLLSEPLPVQFLVIQGPAGTGKVVQFSVSALVQFSLTTDTVRAV